MRMVSVTKNSKIMVSEKLDWIGEVPLMTIGDLRDNHQAYVENGEQKADASKYRNVVNKPLVVGDDHELLIDKMGIPELHVLTGSI